MRMKIVDKLFSDLILPILVAVLAPIATALGSYLLYNDWQNWFKQIPTSVYYAVAFLLFLWILIVIVRNRLRSVHEKNIKVPPIGVQKNPILGYKELGKFPYKGVNWVILYPRQLPWDVGRYPINLSEIDVNIPPHCPKCNTELTEKKSFFYGYIWNCVRCKFKKRNKSSFYLEEDNVIKLIRSHIRNTNNES